MEIKDSLTYLLTYLLTDQRCMLVDNVRDRGQQVFLQICRLLYVKSKAGTRDKIGPLKDEDENLLNGYEDNYERVAQQVVSHRYRYMSYRSGG